MVTHTYLGAIPPDVVKVGTGKYTLSVPCSPAKAGVDGLWGYEWVGTGTVSDVQPGTWRVMDENFTLNLMVLVLITDAAPVDASQRALDAYLGIDHGDGSGQSIPAAILKDTSLSGTVEWCEPVTADAYGRVEYGGIIYFGARISWTGRPRSG